MSEVYRLYNIEDKIEVCGTPANMGFLPENTSSILILNDLWARNESITLMTLSEFHMN